MKKVIASVIMSVMLSVVPLWAQDKKDMQMKGPMEGMSMKGDAMHSGSMDMNKIKEMHDKMMEMKKGAGGMMKGQGMMKSEEMKGMGSMMGDISGMMGNMGQMMNSGKMTPAEMEEMSKMMGDMSGMMKQMSERMKHRGTKN